MRGPTATPQPPPGLLYREDFVDGGEEQELLSRLERMEFEEVRFRGQVARRTVRHFGYGYEYDTHRVDAADPIPSFLLPLRARAAALVGREPERFAELLVTCYPPGASIGWHRDAPTFGSTVVGVSLLSACRMRFRRRSGDAHLAFDLELAPRSAYVLSGAARASWQHSIPPVDAPRYSVTFRTLRRPGPTGGV